MKQRELMEPCPGRRGELHDFLFDWEAKQVYPGPQRRQIAEYCSWCGKTWNYVEDIVDIEPELPVYGPFYKGPPPLRAA